MIGTALVGCASERAPVVFPAGKLTAGVHQIWIVMMDDHRSTEETAGPFRFERLFAYALILGALLGVLHEVFGG